jgi:hypothetical protein
MAHLNVRINKNEKQQLEALALERGLKNISDYVRSLIENDVLENHSNLEKKLDNLESKLNLLSAMLLKTQQAVFILLTSRDEEGRPLNKSNVKRIKQIFPEWFV